MRLPACHELTARDSTPPTTEACAQTTAMLEQLDRSGTVRRSTLQIDSLGGATVALPAGVVSARLASQRLQFVDIVAAPDLHRLDLSETAPGCHLTVAHAPMLAEIAAPAAGRGLILHLCQLGEPPRVQILGAVAQVDVAWWPLGPKGDIPLAGTTPTTAQVATGRRQPEPGQGAYVGPLPDTWPDAEWVVLLGGQYGAKLQVPDSLRCQSLSLQDGDDLESLEVGLPLASLEVRACPKLKTLTLLRPSCKVRLAGCGALSRVVGSGQVLTLAEQSGAEFVGVSGAWHVLHLSVSGAVELVAPAIVEVNLTLCPGIRRVDLLAGSRLRLTHVPHLQEVTGPARVAFDPRSALGALREAIRRDPELREALFADVRLARGTNQTLRALQVLAELARAGIDAERVWSVRMALLQRSRTDRWLWQLPADLADDGWSADVRMWLYCRQSHPPARAWQPQLEREFQPEHLAAVARTLAAVPNDDSPHWIEARVVLASVLLAQLRRGAQSGLPIFVGRSHRMESDGLDTRVEARLQAVVRALTSMRADAFTAALGEAMCGWLLRCLPCAEGLHLMALLVECGVQPARDALVKLAADREIDPALRRLAMALLLADLDQHHAAQA
jgi:hypothetical protein